MSKPYANLHPVQMSIKDATASLAGQEVLHHVTVEINVPGITVVLGPNGAGKSSLLSAMVGLLPLDKGQQEILEKDGKPASITRVGYVLQKPVLLRRSIAGNINYAMAAAGIDRKRRPDLKRHVLDMMNITHDPKLSAFHLSQGERQRLAVARVLAMEPGILMLDEATNSLDQETVSLLEKQIRTLAKQGLPVVWVTHNIDQAKRIANRVIVIKDGRIKTDCLAKDYFTT